MSEKETIQTIINLLEKSKKELCVPSDVEDDILKLLDDSELENAEQIRSLFIQLPGGKSFNEDGPDWQVNSVEKIIEALEKMKVD